MMLKTLTPEEQEQLAAAELAAKEAKAEADEAEAFCFSSASTSVCKDIRLTMFATRAVADEAEKALADLRAKLGL